MTYGEKAVGIAFNPKGNEDVQRMKELYAMIIDFCDQCRTDACDDETIRLYEIAITEAQTAQMWVVKAITWNSN